MRDPRLLRRKFDVCETNCAATFGQALDLSEKPISQGIRSPSEGSISQIQLWLIALQAAAEWPDLQLNANLRARSINLDRQGNGTLTVTKGPDGDNIVDVRAPKNHRIEVEDEGWRPVLTLPFSEALQIMA